MVSIYSILVGMVVCIILNVIVVLLSILNGHNSYMYN